MIYNVIGWSHANSLYRAADKLISNIEAMFDISDWFLENFRPPLESEEGEDVTHFLYVFKLIFGYLNDDISKYLDL